MLKGANLVGLGGSPRIGNDALTKSLLHFEGANGGATFTDSNKPGISRPWSVNGTVTTSTADKKFGAASGLFAGGYLSLGTPGSDFYFGAADTTLDMWINRNGGSGVQFFFGKSNGVVPSILEYCFNFDASNRVRMLKSNSGSITAQTFSNVFPSTGWHHLALVNSGVSVFCFIDGVKDPTVANSAAIQQVSASVELGSSTGQSPFTGYMDEFRLSSVARWTADFSPPSFAYGP